MLALAYWYAMAFVERVTFILILLAVVFGLNFLSETIFPTKRSSAWARMGYDLLVYSLFALMIGGLFAIKAEFDRY